MGPHLSTLHLTEITLRTLHHLLLSSKDLVDIQLHEIENISSGSLLSVLSGMTQLQSLSIRFQSLNFLPIADSIGLDPLSGECVVLPTLTCLKYQGTYMYFDSLVARIDSPHLVDIEITFLEPMFDVSNLRTFVDRIEVQNSHHQTDILFSDNSVSICLTQPTLTCLKLQVFCKTPSQQLFSVARFSSFLFYVEDVRIEAVGLAKRLPSTLVDGGRWMEFIIRPIQRCEMVASSWRLLDGYRACFVPIRHAARNCPARHAQTLHPRA